MKRAKTAQGTAPAPQLNILADDFFNIVAAYHFLYVFLRNQIRSTSPGIA